MKKTKEASPAVDWSSYGASGFEAMQTDDLGIPFLELIQDGSPEFKTSHPRHDELKVEGCKPGDVINSLSREILPQPIHFIPCFYQKLLVEWKPRGAVNGGIVRSHSDPAILAECTRNDKNEDILRNGNVIVTTAYFFGIQVNGEHKPAVVSLTSTQLKKARLWLNMATAIKVETPKGPITPPMFSHKYALSTGPENNAKGSWYGWKIECAGMLEEPDLIGFASQFSKQVQAQQRNLIAGPNESGDDGSVPV
jgi:hypothetical protein